MSQDEWNDYVEEMEYKGLEVNLDDLVETIRQLPPAMKAELGVSDDTNLIELAKQLTLRMKRVVETGSI